MDGTGVPALDTVLVWGGALTVLTGLGALAWRAVRGTVLLLRRIEHFIDDWTGEEPRPGVPGRPGVMERLGHFEERLGRVEHELYPNSGESLRDAVDLANLRLARICPDPPDDCGGPDRPPTVPSASPEAR
ncbi:hypothetical protein ABZ593_20705 [Streptomyces sp. NPDC012617]|uniref:hypothetical protein n=1 Tax=Streptomyces TaxID=1883 RepID=UPI003410FA09